ncbi:MAG: hypothetical protein ACKVRN_04105 [Pyrinomonadaceae bacterium]
MTQPQATAEVFWTAFQALKPAEREAFIGKLMKDRRFANDISKNGDKMALMNKAMSDPLFLADLKEVESDFSHVDLEEVIG